MTDKERVGTKCPICGDIHRAKEKDRLPIDCDVCKHEIGDPGIIWSFSCLCICHNHFRLGRDAAMSGYGFTLQYNSKT